MLVTGCVLVIVCGGSPAQALEPAQELKERLSSGANEPLQHKVYLPRAARTYGRPVEWCADSELPDMPYSTVGAIPVITLARLDNQMGSHDNKRGSSHRTLSYEIVHTLACPEKLEGCSSNDLHTSWSGAPATRVIPF